MAIKRIGYTFGIQDPLVLELGEQCDDCCNELGIAGCARCPVAAKCKWLWREIEEIYDRKLTQAEFRQYSQKLSMLKEERQQCYQESLR